MNYSNKSAAEFRQVVLIQASQSKIKEVIHQHQSKALTVMRLHLHKMYNR